MSKRDQVETILQLWIDLTRQIHSAAEPARQQRFGAQTGPLLISAAVFAATLARRPMTAHKLAGYVGMARPTVIRHLRQLEETGVVRRDQHRRYFTTTSEIERMLSSKTLSATAHLVRAAAGRLSD